MDNIKSEILEALEKHKGIVSTACASIGLARSTYYSWLSSDEAFKAAVDDIQETAIDFVESKLMEKINGVTVMGKEDIYEQPPSDTAIIFYLKTKGKKRGYVERSEVAVEGKNIPFLSYDPFDLADETNNSIKKDIEP